MARDVEKSILLYFYDRETGGYFKSGSSGDADNYTKPVNSVIVAPPEIPEGHAARINSDKSGWDIIQMSMTTVTNSGFVIARYSALPMLSKVVDITQVFDEIPSEFTKPRWNGTEWVDAPIPSGFFYEVWNDETESWEEALAGDDLASAIDRQTDQMITDWCIAQQKNEAYYMNKGIVDISDVEYVAYQAQKTIIIDAQQQKKIDAGVY